MGGYFKVWGRLIGKKNCLDFELKDNEGELVYQIPKHINARVDIKIELLYICICISIFYM